MIPLHIIDRGSTFVVRGHAQRHLAAVGIRTLFIGGEARGFVADTVPHLANLCAYLDAQGVPYRLHRGDDA